MQDLVNNLAASALAVFLFKEIWDFFKGSAKEHLKALRDNTVAVIRLEERIKMLTERTDKIPKMEKDINEAHYKLRLISELVRPPSHPTQNQEPIR
jgi:hypothetical protein